MAWSRPWDLMTIPRAPLVHGDDPPSMLGVGLSALSLVDAIHLRSHSASNPRTPLTTAHAKSYVGWPPPLDAQPACTSTASSSADIGRGGVGSCSSLHITLPLDVASMPGHAASPDSDTPPPPPAPANQACQLRCQHLRYANHLYNMLLCVH